MSWETCLIVHRKSANQPRVKAAVQHVKKRGIRLRVRIPWNKKDKARVVQEALDDGATRIIAGGGDGTLNAIASALIGDGQTPPDCEMGILPLGTANDFAHGCGLPVEDLDACLEIACTTPARAIDVGRVNGRSFINVASGGYGAEITATTSVKMKKALGGGAYTLMGLVKALSFVPYEGRLLVPGETPLEGSLVLMAVGNNRLAGGGFEVAPEARMDDGLLDVALVGSEAGDAGLAGLARNVRSARAGLSAHIIKRQLAAFTLEMEQKLHVNLDGEPLRAKRLEFSVLPGHLKVVY